MDVRRNGREEKEMTEVKKERRGRKKVSGLGAKDRRKQGWMNERDRWKDEQNKKR